MTKLIEFEITGKEAALILEHACPFDEEATQFEVVAGKKGYHRIRLEKNWLQMITADLVYTMKRSNSYKLKIELDEICEVIEAAYD